MEMVIGTKWIREHEEALGELVLRGLRWECERYDVKVPLVIRIDKHGNSSGWCLGTFTLSEIEGIPQGEPKIVLSFDNPAVRAKPEELLITLFHEFYHYLEWTRDPDSYTREKNLPRSHPVEIEYDRRAYEDFDSYLKDRS